MVWETNSESSGTWSRMIVEIKVSFNHSFESITNFLTFRYRLAGSTQVLSNDISAYARH